MFNFMKQKYLIAVSGGPDSMALLNKKKNLIKAVCHVNYHDREDTDNDERIVRDIYGLILIEHYLLFLKAGFS